MRKITILIGVFFVFLNISLYADSWSSFTNGKIDSFEINLEQISGRGVSRYYMIKWYALDQKCHGIIANKGHKREPVVITKSTCDKMRDYLVKNKVGIISYEKANPIFPKYIPKPSNVGKLSMFGKEFKVNMSTNATCDSDDNCVEPVLNSVDKLADYLSELLFDKFENH